MHALRGIALLGIALLGGCSFGWGSPPGPPTLTVHAQTTTLTPAQQKAEDAAVVGWKTRFAAANTPALRAELSQELVSYLTSRSDEECEDFLTRVSADRNGYSATLSILSFAASTIGSVVTPVRDANNLAAASSLFAGASARATDTLFGGRDFPLLYAAVKNGRAKKRAELLTEVSKPNGRMSTWGVDALVAEVKAYHTDCGVNYGLQRLNEALVD